METPAFMPGRTSIFATKVRDLQELGLSATASTRLLSHAASLLHSGMEPRIACRVGVTKPLTDDMETLATLHDTASLIL